MIFRPLIVLILMCNFFYVSIEQQVEEERKQWMEDAKIEANIREEFNCLIENEKINLLPKGTKVEYVIFISNNLYINFSKEILNYGGTMWEEEMINNILEIAFEDEEVETVTIAIEGEIKNFVEGTIINMYTRDKWLERKK